MRSGWVIAIFGVIAAGAFGITNAVISFLNLYPRRPLSLDDGYLIFSSLQMVVAAGVPTLICAVALKARVGLPPAGGPRDFPIGFAIGAAIVSLAVLIPVVAGQGSLTIDNESAGVVALAGIQQLATLGPTAFGEELLLRGVVLHKLSEGTRPWLAVLATGACFGVMHLMNPSATLIAAANIALVGILFGVLALRASLWTSIGAHVAWNWFEGFFYGQPVSGIQPGHALFVGTLRAPGFFSGGDFGPEASGITAVLLSIAVLIAVASPRFDRHWLFARVPADDAES